MTVIAAALVSAAVFGASLLLPGDRAIEVGAVCDSAAVVVVDDVAYAPCADSSVVAVDLSEAEPRVIGVQSLPGVVTGLHVNRGKVWAEVTRFEAHPLERRAFMSLPQPVPVNAGVASAVADTKTVRPASRMFPARQGGIAALALTLRPLLPLGTLGAGTIADISAAYHFDRPIAVGLVVEPLAGAVTNDRDVGSVGVTGFVTYDHDYFALGLGLGVTTLAELVYGSDGFPSGQDTALVIAQLARIGALDGLNLTIRNSFAVVGEEFEYNGTRARAQLPLTDAIALFGGGGAAQGFAFGELGARFRAFGTGSVDTLFVELSAGGGAVDGVIDLADCGDGNPCRSTESYGGPLVGAGVEYRL